MNPMYQEFLNTKGQTHLFFQSFVWICLTGWILRDPTFLWGPKLSVAFDTLLEVRQSKSLIVTLFATILLNNTAESKEDLHSWRARTGEIIQDARGIDSQTECDLKNDIYFSIVQFIPKGTLSNEKHKEIIHRSIERIIDKAIKIAVIFNQSRCVYRLREVLPRERFSRRTMEYDEECDAPQVDLMISPGLLKFGNSRGEDYDQRLVLVKSRVCTLKQNTDKDGEEDEDGTGESDGNGDEEVTDDEEEECLIDL
ncbi:hypothetical protein F4679DRAFT_532316 [Xylaria curta]|nr:hypothetical protein F4679DRAFT_532316 [Xylaria curta]